MNEYATMARPVLRHGSCDEVTAVGFDRGCLSNLVFRLCDIFVCTVWLLERIVSGGEEVRCAPMNNSLYVIVAQCSPSYTVYITLTWIGSAMCLNEHQSFSTYRPMLSKLHGVHPVSLERFTCLQKIAQGDAGSCSDSWDVNIRWGLCSL